jgi:hypothetical protein
VEPLLVSADVAAVWAGRPIGTIYRWASEGRQGVHRTDSGTLYDLRVIPPKNDDGPGQPPPLKKTENADGVGPERTCAEPAAA